MSDFIIPPKPKPCMHGKCGDPFRFDGAVLTCPDCNKIIHAKTNADGYTHWYERSERWLNRKLRKLRKNETR